MAHEFEFDIDNPIDIHKAGLGAQEIKKTRAMVKERFDVDHNNSGVLDEGASQDGTHKKVTLRGLEANPTIISGAGILFARIEEDEEDIERANLYYAEQSGSVVKITDGGSFAFSNPNFSRRSGYTAVAGQMPFGTEIESSGIIYTAGTKYLFGFNNAGGVYLISVRLQASAMRTVNLYIGDSSASSIEPYASWCIIDDDITDRFIVAEIESTDHLWIEIKNGGAFGSINILQI